MPFIRKNPFENKVALITGGASGIGRAVGEEMARRGAMVILADIQGDLALKAVEDIRAAGGRAEGAMLDVTDAETVRPVFASLRGLFDATCERFPSGDWQHLSMGMTDDLEVAVEEGSTIVRIGRAIFGARSH